MEYSEPSSGISLLDVHRVRNKLKDIGDNRMTHCIRTKVKYSLSHYGFESLHSVSEMRGV